MLKEKRGGNIIVMEGLWDLSKRHISKFHIRSLFIH